MLNWTERQCIFYLLPLIISISFAMDVFVPAIPTMVSYFQSTPSVLQASLYGFMLVVAVGQLVIGPLCDRFGRRNVALCSAGLFLVGSLFSAITNSVAIFILTRLFQAFGACGTYLVCFIIVRDNFDTQACGRMFSLLMGLNACVASSAPVIGGVLLDMTGSWRSGFFFLTLLSLLILAVVSRTIPNYAYPKPTQQKGELFKRYNTILANGHFRQFAWASCCSFLCLYLFCALSPEILIEQLHNSGTQYGMWFGLNAITVYGSNLVAARLTHRYSLESMINLGLVFIISGAIAMLLLNVHQHSSLRFMLPMLGITVGVGFSMGSAVAVALKHYQQSASTATALVSACQFGSSGLFGYGLAQFPITSDSLAVPVLLVTLVSLLMNGWKQYQNVVQVPGQS